MDTQSLGRYLRCLLSQEAMLYVMEADDYLWTMVLSSFGRVDGVNTSALCRCLLERWRDII